MSIFESEIIVTLLKIAAILLASALAAVLVRRAEKRLNKLRGGEDLSRKLFYRTLICLIWSIGVLTAIGQVSALRSMVTTLLAGSGVFALVIGLAAQDGFGNIIGGFFLSIFKPFNVGDKIVMPDHNVTGVVEDISLRHTVIRTVNGSRVVVPNGTMNSAVIENVNYVSEDGIISWVDVSVAYDTDVAKASEILYNIIHSDPRYYPYTGDNVSAEIASVLLRRLGDSGLELRGAVRTRNLNDSFNACSDIRAEVVRQYAAAGIEIPYNKLDVHLDCPENT